MNDDHDSVGHVRSFKIRCGLLLIVNNCKALKSTTMLQVFRARVSALAGMPLRGLAPGGKKGKDKGMLH